MATLIHLRRLFRSLLAPARPRWRSAIVAAPGPSLTEELGARLAMQYPVVAVNDAWWRVPSAAVLYAADYRWWEHRAPKKEDFRGERWTCCNSDLCPENASLKAAGVRLMRAEHEPLFSEHADRIHLGFGNNSGFQAINLAMAFGARHIVLVGFDMRLVEGREHFWGNYEAKPFHAPEFQLFINGFNLAAESMPVGVRVVNATQNSALKCFASMTYEQALDDRLLWNRTIDQRATS